ncbi:asparaginase-domain-containing protein [Sanghuangporus baumii]|uniref:Asparaginase-domain-containing protein n=1 Tax=Sanghuangporus baumii TaxID=108892 RepID=A0A9Q5HQL2_SANBA|nr:asparaginase-domain-containing protein [Sanghuangporus baumii]
MDTYRPSDEARVLVIYTGGTIGICQSRFHDPLEDSLFSHSGTIDGFRKWSTSGRSSPVSGAHFPALKETPTLTVKSTRPIPPSLLTDPAKSHLSQASSCRKIDNNVYECTLPSLVTPRTSVHTGNSKRIRYAILEWDPLLDSSNVGTEDWVRIATEIELNYAAFDAFVILHGTDTMAYTSSALSFMLEDLGKTVILTGAQIPLSQLRNDAVDNLLGALSIAGQYIIPECCLFFNQCLYRGNRVSKVSSYDFDAFDSPNFLPLVNADIVRAFLIPPIQGVVLETFGAGNAPQRRDLMEVLREASDRCVVVAITQCSKGTVSDAYETGRALLDIGIVPGGDMTPECALAKLGYLLSKPQLSVQKVRELVRLPLRGELTAPSGQSSKPSMTQHLDSLQDCLAQMMRLSNTSSPHVPQIIINQDQGTGQNIIDPAAPWSWTVAEASATQSTLLNILIRLAVAKDDVDGLEFCLRYQDDDDVLRSPSVEKSISTPAAGIANNIDPSSGWTPLHVAAFNGSERSVATLLQAGALVHLRDSLGHTALYYAARRGYPNIVELLRQAGANLGGTDIEGGFVTLEVTRAAHKGDEVALETWNRAGYNPATHYIMACR